MKTRINHQTIHEMGNYKGIEIESLPPDVLRSLYHYMLRLRVCEEVLIREYRVAEEIRCPVHFSIGQEAVSSALTLLLETDDFLFCHHRSHGYYLAKGAPMEKLFSELFGRESGANGGLAGSQEISYPPANFHSGAVLTGATAIAVGASLSFQLKKQRQIAVACFGEAATEEGVFWEAINYASVRKLPLVYVCENNVYSMYSPQLKRQALDNIHERVSAFGIRSEAHFGNDAPLAYRALKEAFAWAREGKGPCFLEFYTYRWSAHVGPESDDHIGYRLPGYLDFWKKHCPISLLEQKLLEAGVITPGVKQEMREKIEKEIAGALAFARGSAFPSPDSFLQYNYSDSAPLADRLLKEGEFEKFDGYQPDAILAPY